MRKPEDAETASYTTSGLVSVQQIVDTTNDQVYYPNTSTNPEIVRYLVKPEK